MIDHIANRPAIAFDLGSLRPVGYLIGWQFAIDRVDPECEQMIELGIERRMVKQSSVQEIPVERVKVAAIKADSMAFADRTVIERLVDQQPEQAVGRRTGVIEA